MLGLNLGGGGSAFSGSYTVKGCYAYKSDHAKYANSAFFGQGGSKTQMKEETADFPTNYRVKAGCSSVKDDITTRRSCEAELGPNTLRRGFFSLNS